jgi:cytochrome c biogenesis protein CcmG/thiol:disulfide interchange protein DsbE
MTRRQVIGFVVVLALIGAGLLLRSRDSSGPDPLPGLRRAAALQPCPAGLGPELPDLTLACLGGGSDVRLRSAAPGRPTLVNIWATWCGPCVREVPALVTFARRAGDRVAVVGVDTTDEDDKALTFARQYGMHYPSVVDPDGRVLRAFGGGPPITLLLDAEGTVRFRHRGELTSPDEIAALVRQHLGVTL